jgi:hypothetical protein
MTMPRRKTHRLVVDGRELRWAIRRGGHRACPGCSTMHLVLVDGSRRGAVVVGSFECSRMNNGERQLTTNR